MPPPVPAPITLPQHVTHPRTTVVADLPGLDGMIVRDVYAVGTLLVFLLMGEGTGEQVLIFHTVSRLFRVLARDSQCHYTVHGAYVVGTSPGQPTLLVDLRPLFTGYDVFATPCSKLVSYHRLDGDIVRLSHNADSLVAVTDAGSVYISGPAPALVMAADAPAPLPGSAQHTLYSALANEYLARSAPLAPDELVPTELARLPYVERVRDAVISSEYLLLVFHGATGIGHLALGNAGPSRAGHALAVFPEKVERLEATAQHVLILCENGELYGFGSDLNGELGRDDAAAMTEPQYLGPINHHRQVVAGAGFTAVLADWDLRVTGRDNGQFGLPAAAGRRVQRSFVSVWVTQTEARLRSPRLSMSSTRSVVVDTDGRVYMAGHATDGFTILHRLTDLS